MIPKIIHYCWFGGKPLPKEALKCINSWKKYCPDYEIKEWNESNYNLTKNDYVKYCYENKKWAFLTDYVRLDIVYQNGGIYLDTDVELVKPLDDFLCNKCYIGMEQVGTVNTGQGFGAVKHHKFIKENKDYYEKKPFLNDDGSFKRTICVPITTEILKKKGLINKNCIQNLEDEVVVYPVEYFCPKKLGTNKITITKNTVSIHHFESSWKSNNRLIRRIGYHLIPLKILVKKIIRKEEQKNGQN